MNNKNEEDHFRWIGIIADRIICAKNPENELPLLSLSFLSDCNNISIFSNFPRPTFPVTVETLSNANLYGIIISAILFNINNKLSKKQDDFIFDFDIILKDLSSIGYIPQNPCDSVGLREGKVEHHLNLCKSIEFLVVDRSLNIESLLYDLRHLPRSFFVLKSDIQIDLLEDAVSLWLSKFHCNSHFDEEITELNVEYETTKDNIYDLNQKNYIIQIDTSKFSKVAACLARTFPKQINKNEILKGTDDNEIQSNIKLSKFILEKLNAFVIEKFPTDEHLFMLFISDLFYATRSGVKKFVKLDQPPLIKIHSQPQTPLQAVNCSINRQQPGSVQNLNQYPQNFTNCKFNTKFDNPCSNFKKNPIISAKPNPIIPLKSKIQPKLVKPKIEQSHSICSPKEINKKKEKRKPQTNKVKNAKLSPLNNLKPNQTKKCIIEFPEIEILLKKLIEKWPQNENYYRNLYNIFISVAQEAKQIDSPFIPEIINATKLTFQRLLEGQQKLDINFEEMLRKIFMKSQEPINSKNENNSESKNGSIIENNDVSIHSENDGCTDIDVGKSPKLLELAECSFEEEEEEEIDDSAKSKNRKNKKEDKNKKDSDNSNKYEFNRNNEQIEDDNESNKEVKLLELAEKVSSSDIDDDDESKNVLNNNSNDNHNEDASSSNRKEGGINNNSIVIDNDQSKNEPNAKRSSLNNPNNNHQDESSKNKNKNEDENQSYLTENRSNASSYNPNDNEDKNIKNLNENENKNDLSENLTNVNAEGSNKLNTSSYSNENKANLIEDGAITDLNENGEFNNDRSHSHSNESDVENRKDLIEDKTINSANETVHNEFNNNRNASRSSSNENEDANNLNENGSFADTNEDGEHKNELNTIHNSNENEDDNRKDLIEDRTVNDVNENDEFSNKQNANHVSNENEDENRNDMIEDRTVNEKNEKDEFNNKQNVCHHLDKNEDENRNVLIEDGNESLIDELCNEQNANENTNVVNEEEEMTDEMILREAEKLSQNFSTKVKRFTSNRRAKVTSTRKSSTVPNYQTIINALRFNSLPGPKYEKLLDSIIEILKEFKEERLLLLMASRTQKFKGVYVLSIDGMSAQKLWGNGPNNVLNENVGIYYKYVNGSKSFDVISTKSFTQTTDGFSLKKKLESDSW